jgi:hypothetical protein
MKAKKDILWVFANNLTSSKGKFDKLLILRPAA